MDPTPPCAFFISLQSSHMAQSSVCFKDCIAPAFDQFKEDTSVKVGKSGLRSSAHKAITEPMCICRAWLVVHVVIDTHSLP